MKATNTPSKAKRFNTWDESSNYPVCVLPLLQPTPCCWDWMSHVTWLTSHMTVYHRGHGLRCCWIFRRRLMAIRINGECFTPFSASRLKSGKQHFCEHQHEADLCISTLRMFQCKQIQLCCLITVIFTKPKCESKKFCNVEGISYLILSTCGSKKRRGVSFW